MNIFAALKKDALVLCSDEDSQMKELWKQVQAEIKPQQQQAKKQKQPTQDEHKQDEVGDLAKLMKDLRTQQLKLQKSRILVEVQGNRIWWNILFGLWFSKGIYRKSLVA